MMSTNARKRVIARASQRKVAIEGETVGKKLFAYALAASVGAILLPSEAAAKVVYTPMYAHTIDPIQGISIDLDHNGIVDFVVASSNFSGVNTVSARPSVTGNQILSTLSHGEPAAAALMPGAYIGAGAKFAANANYMAFSYQCADFQGGPW